MMKKLYIIDDDNDFLDIVSYILREHYHVKSATSLNVEDLVHFKPDLILMDNSVGTDISGGMISRLQSTVPEFDIPVILVSAHHDISSLADKKGVCGYIQKPASISHIRKYVREFFEKVA